MATKILDSPLLKACITAFLSDWCTSPCIKSDSKLNSFNFCDKSMLVILRVVKIKTLPTVMSPLKTKWIVRRTKFTSRQSNDIGNEPRPFLVLFIEDLDNLGHVLIGLADKFGYVIVSSLLSIHTSPTWPCTIFIGSVRTSLANFSTFALNVALKSSAAKEDHNVIYR